MPDAFSGGCACGAIRYTCTAAPRFMGNCHCRDCRRATGSAYFPAVVVKEADFALTGTPAWYETAADRGHMMRRAFCAACGSPVFLINGSRTDVRVLYAGSLDDPSWYQPSRDIYVSSAQPWDLMHAELPKGLSVNNLYTAAGAMV